MDGGARGGSSIDIDFASGVKATDGKWRKVEKGAGGKDGPDGNRDVMRGGQLRGRKLWPTAYRGLGNFFGGTAATRL